MTDGRASPSRRVFQGFPDGGFGEAPRPISGSAGLLGRFRRLILGDIGYARPYPKQREEAMSHISGTPKRS